MQYKLFIYSPVCKTANRHILTTINKALISDSDKVWGYNSAAQYMNIFDFRLISEKISAELGSLCKVHFMVTPAITGSKEYLRVFTSYEHASSVLPYLYFITSTYNLALYDSEIGKTHYMDLINFPYINARNRISSLLKQISQGMKPIWNIRKIGSFITDSHNDFTYVVTIRRDCNKSFERRVEDFYSCLCKNILGSEKLKNRNECFTIKGDEYTITFCLEGYKKHPDKIGFYLNGCPCSRLLHRISCEEASRWAKNIPKMFNTVCGRMNYYEMVRNYPNPADRFAASVNISKQLLKLKLDINYRGIGPYGSSFLFHMVPNIYDNDSSNISVLAIEEESCSFILPFINKFYPFVYERYFSENYIPIQQFTAITEYLKKVSKLMIVDPSHDVLKPYIKYFNLYVLADENERIKIFEGNISDVLYSHRFDIVKLYDIFISWAEEQIKNAELFGSLSVMINIQGP